MSTDLGNFFAEIQTKKSGLSAVIPVSIYHGKPQTARSGIRVKRNRANFGEQTNSSNIDVASHLSKQAISSYAKQKRL